MCIYPALLLIPFIFIYAYKKNGTRSKEREVDWTVFHSYPRRASIYLGALKVFFYS